MNKIEVLVPTAEAKLDQFQMAVRPDNLKGKMLGFLWDVKPNGDLFLGSLEKELKEILKPSATVMREKPLASSGAPSAVIQELSNTCDFVILAVGD